MKDKMVGKLEPLNLVHIVAHPVHDAVFGGHVLIELEGLPFRGDVLWLELHRKVVDYNVGLCDGNVMDHHRTPQRDTKFVNHFVILVK